MKTLLFILAFIQCATNAVEVKNNNDTVFIFADEIGLKTADGSATNWYAAHDTTQLLAQGVSELYPDEGIGVAVKHNNQWERCYVVKMDKKPNPLVVQADCQSTLAFISGGIPSLSYIGRDGTPQYLTRTIHFQYNNLVWKDKEGWIDTPLSSTFEAEGTNYLLPPLYAQPTSIVMFTDSAWRDQLGLAMDSTFAEIAVPVAFAIHPTHTASTRWEGVETNHVNEENPPSDAQFLVGSGPTEINFESHPTPAAEWYEWNFYKNGNLLFTRRDQDQRYLFDEFANYEVKLSVTGGDCRRDTTFAVTIEESFLNVPNVFTPNGDGMNDEFRVDYKSIVDFHIWVYNRWNKLVYESTNPAEGWDGNIGGRPAASGAYFYVIRAKGANAAENAKYMSKIAFDKKKKSANPDDLNALIGIYQLSGDINLIR